MPGSWHSCWPPAGVGLIAGRWFDRVFVRLRRALELRLELMVLSVSEFIALSYFRPVVTALVTGWASEVAGGILADKERHIRFHAERLRLSFAQLPGRYANRVAVAEVPAVGVVAAGRAVARRAARHREEAGVRVLFRASRPGTSVALPHRPFRSSATNPWLPRSAGYPASV